MERTKGTLLKTCTFHTNTPYSVSRTYDLAGNMLVKTDNNSSGMGWQVVEQDSVGRPKKIDYDTAIADIGERHIEYDQDNMPTRIVFKGNETTLFYDGDSTRVKKVSATGTVIYAGGLYEVRGGSTVLHIFGAGKRIVSIEGTETYYYHTDHLNSTTVVTDVNGNRVEELGYLPFGSLLYRNAYQGGQWSTVYRFTGQEYDAEFALYNYNARLYDPIMGRFISPDPVIQDPYNPQNLNRYTYCLNNPLIYIDPTGNYFGESVVDAIGGFFSDVGGYIWGGISNAWNRVFGSERPNTGGAYGGMGGLDIPVQNQVSQGNVNMNSSTVNMPTENNIFGIGDWGLPQEFIKGEFDPNTFTTTFRMGGSGMYLFTLDTGNLTTNMSGDPYKVGSHGPAPVGRYPVQPPVRITDPKEKIRYGDYFWPIGARGIHGERLDIASQRRVGWHTGRQNYLDATWGCLRGNNRDAPFLYNYPLPWTWIDILPRRSPPPFGYP